MSHSPMFKLLDSTLFSMFTYPMAEDKSRYNRHEYNFILSGRWKLTSHSLNWLLFESTPTDMHSSGF